MSFTGYLCFGSLLVFLLGLILDSRPMAAFGFVLLVAGMFIVVIDED